MLKILPAQISDVPFYCEHLHRHGLESGRNGNFIFSPNEEPWDITFEELDKSCREKWGKTPTDLGWERTWFLADIHGIYGHINLVHRPPLKSCLHRATLMLGIENAYRGKGFGSQLMETAISWAKSQPSLDWLQLFAFEENEPAIKMYKKFGFIEDGKAVDMFRVFGKQITDVSMVLKLK
jgi:RimJ/RimL family protein N-acetyltransferase